MNKAEDETSEAKDKIEDLVQISTYKKLQNTGKEYNENVVAMKASKQTKPHKKQTFKLQA